MRWKRCINATHASIIDTLLPRRKIRRYQIRFVKANVMYLHKAEASLRNNARAVEHVVHRRTEKKKPDNASKHLKDIKFSRPHFSTKAKFWRLPHNIKKWMERKAFFAHFKQVRKILQPCTLLAKHQKKLLPVLITISKKLPGKNNSALSRIHFCAQFAWVHDTSDTPLYIHEDVVLKLHVKALYR